MLLCVIAPKRSSHLSELEKGLPEVGSSFFSCTLTSLVTSSQSLAHTLSFYQSDVGQHRCPRSSHRPGDS